MKHARAVEKINVEILTDLPTKGALGKAPFLYMVISILKGESMKYCWGNRSYRQDTSCLLIVYKMSINILCIDHGKLCGMHASANR